MAPPVGERIPEMWETSEFCVSAGPIIRIPAYKNVRRDDLVVCVDQYWPKFYGMRFRWLCYVHNIDSGVGWAEVYGGPTGQQWVRAFPVHALRVLH